MKNLLSMGLLIFLAAVLQTTLFPQLFQTAAHLLGASWLSFQTVDLVLLVLIFLALRKDLWTLLPWAMVISLLAGLFGTAWSGVATASYFSVALVCAVVSKRLLLERNSSIAVFCAFVSLGKGLAYLQMGHMVARFPHPFEGQMGTLFFQAMATAIFAPVVFWILAGVDEGSGGGQRRQSQNELILDL